MVNYLLMITAELENLTNLEPQGGYDDPNFTYYFKCKFCGREGTVSMITGRGRPLTHEISQSGNYVPLMLFDCRGYEPVEFAFGSGWKVESIEGTKFDAVDLSGGDFAEYDEKGECPVMISNVRSVFNVVK
ncbi:hypothetical protein Vadar_013493 [Vaccinium darrowii]|uniref:Uncharacterized protein n=1 Tax=Vaccinium darrowii TaxID=229202 RepID=A0ACB7Y092_9ERIC|nr:hypothetical protein Vadar_013493 [Vaccinium darrowii]